MEIINGIIFALTLLKRTTHSRLSRFCSSLFEEPTPEGAPLTFFRKSARKKPIFLCADVRSPVPREVDPTIPKRKLHRLCRRHSSKTTLADIVLGAPPSDSVVLLVDGVPDRDGNSSSLASQSGLCSQEIYLTDATIAAYIALRSGRRKGQDGFWDELPVVLILSCTNC